MIDRKRVSISLPGRGTKYEYTYEEWDVFVDGEAAGIIVTENDDYEGSCFRVNIPDIGFNSYPLFSDALDALLGNLDDAQNR